MSKITRFVLGILLFSSYLGAAEEVKYQHRFVLKKDEPALILVNHIEVTRRPTAENPNNEYLLKFRWTLFTNNMLTLLSNYRGYPTQYILEKKHPLQNFVVMLLPVRKNPITSRTFARVQFVDFNQTSKEATLDVFIIDQENRIEVEFKPKKKE